MTNIKSTYTLTFTSTSPFNEATYPDQSLEEAVAFEEEIDLDGILEILQGGSYKNEDFKVTVEVID